MAKKQQLKIEYVPTDKLKPNARNPRKNDPVVVKLVQSIESFGWTNPILALPNQTIIAGHTRWKAAQQAGLTTVPVIYLKMTKAQADQYMIADNKLTELAEWDTEGLAELFAEFKTQGMDLDLTGFNTDEIATILGDKDYDNGLTDEDATPEPPKKPKSRPGDVYALGDHRLLCGDCTQPDAIQTLMDGKLADMAWTDPPYNVNYKQKVTNYISNDNMSDVAFYTFLHAAYTSLLAGHKPGGIAYISHADSERVNFTKAFVDAGFYFAQALIWVKNSATLSRSDFNWKHEPILYGWKPGAAHYFCGNFCLTSVIDDDTDIEKLKKEDLLAIVKQIKEQTPETIIRCDRPTKSELHPTMKPIALIQRMLEWSSKPGQIVLDVFGGSGSTLIASQKTNRTCYTMELDPGYCDVIVQRWEEYTGKKATLLTGGKAKKHVA
jgi:DNA modification methylase